MINCIIPTRLASQRLPGKALMDLCGKPVLAHIFDRLKQTKVDKIIVATTQNKEDDAIIQECMDNGVYYFRGSENDVLGRYYHCADYYGLKDNDGILRITHDCPLIDPVIVNQLINLWQKNKDKYVSNVEPPTYPDGMDCEIFSFGLLKQAWEHGQDEHVTTWLRKNADKAILKNDTDLTKLRLTLDTQADYLTIRKIYEELYKPGKIFGLKEILKYLEG